MKQWLSPSLGVLALGSAVVGLPFTGPKIGRATQAQIEAVLPTSLRIQPAKPDPTGEARYKKLLALAKRAKDSEASKALGRESDPGVRARVEKRIRPIWDEVENTLDGPIRLPKRKDGGAFGFPEMAEFKGLAKLIALSATEAASRHDQVAAARYGRLGLQLGRAMIEAHAAVIDLLVVVAMEAIAERAVYNAEMAGGFEDRGRSQILALLSPLNDPMPQFREAIRNEFFAEKMPLLLDPIKEWGLDDIKDDKGRKVAAPGSYDPILTARLVGQIFDAALADAGRRIDQQTNLAGKLAEKAGKGLPSIDGGKAAYIEEMNRIPNSIGKMIASLSAPPTMAVVAARASAERNLIRSVFLVRSGKTATLSDPFGHSSLRIDTKRRIVWSVGENGRDDGGKIEKGPDGKSLDLGYRY